MKTGGGRIRIEEIFEPALRARLEDFLASDRPAAQVSKALLVAGAMGCVVFAGAVAPNLFYAFGRMFGRKNKISKEGFYRLRKSIYNLKRQRLIEYVGTKNEEDIYSFTNTGKAKLKKFIFNEMAIPAPKKWNRQIYLIMFDIPHNKKAARDALRRKLQELGCFSFQKSVWAHPFPCYEEIMYIADVFGVAKYVEIVETKNLTNPSVFEYFGGLIKDYL